MQPSLYPLIQSWPTRSHSAKPCSSSGDGDSVLFHNELRYQTGTALTRCVSFEPDGNPRCKAALGTQGVGTGT